MSTTPEESMISIIQAVIHHSSNGVWWTRELHCAVQQNAN
jgi:hypothetical protein